MPEERNAGAGANAATPRSPLAERVAPPRKRWLRRVLLVAGPLLVLIVAGYSYLTTGRFAGTENAYIKADKVVVSAQAAGPIAEVAVVENQKIVAGDVLFVVDDRPYRIAVARADAQMQTVHALLDSLKASYLQRLEKLELARTNVAFTKRELEREQALTERNLGSEVDVEDARHEFDIASRRILIVEQQLAQLRAQLGGTPGHGKDQVSGHAAYVAAKAARDTAALDLEHTIVRAPFDGVASKVPLLGQYVAPGTPVMSIVSDHDVWIEANYKETDLRYVSVGQRVRIHIDTYPDREWRGKVESISQASGAEFSVIPAQNATGNWVKVTQRVPVRIALDTAAADPVLRSGMSAEVEIDTGHERRLPAFLSFLRQEALVDAVSTGTAYRNE